MSNIEKLIELAKEHPELPIIPMVYSEVVRNDAYGCWLGRISSVEIGEYYVCKENGRVYTDIIKLTEYLAYKYLDKWSELTDEEFSEKVNELAKSLMAKAIIIYIDVPEV